MKTIMDDVRAFHEACGVPVQYRPAAPSAERVELRAKLIHEEVNDELLPALARGDLVEAADAMADAIYVIVGTALEYGIPLGDVWAAVQAANMAKVDTQTGQVRRRVDGKILKPEGWTPPNIDAVLRRAGM